MRETERVLCIEIKCKKTETRKRRRGVKRKINKNRLFLPGERSEADAMCTESKGINRR